MKTIYKKWLSTRDLVFLNKYRFYSNKITLINKCTGNRFTIMFSLILLILKQMWDNVNLIINKKRPSSYIEKLNVDDKCYLQP